MDPISPTKGTGLWLAPILDEAGKRLRRAGQLAQPTDVRFLAGVRLELLPVGGMARKDSPELALFLHRDVQVVQEWADQLRQQGLLVEEKVHVAF